MTRRTFVTTAGTNALINAAKTGTDTILLNTIKFGPDVISTGTETTDMGTVVATCTGVGGKNVGDSTIHITGTDASDAAYDVHTVGVFTSTGILFALCSDSDVIISKTATSMASVALDFFISSADPSVIEFGETNFVNPPATTATAGVVRLATEQEATAGADNTLGMTPWSTAKAISSQTAKAALSANTAIKLTNARTINGTAFNGTANITTAAWGTSRSMTISDNYGQKSAKNIDGSANAVWTLPNGFTFPVGIIIPFAGTKSIPSGFLLCNGALISRTTYANLFAAIGTAYGTGDGSTTFALPDYRDRVLQGASSSHAAGTYIAAGLPNITGEYRYQHDFAGPTSSGAFGFRWITSNVNEIQLLGSLPDSTERSWDRLFDASGSNSIYGASTTVQPKATAVQYLIKY